jgi:hypothetical protein
MAGMVASFCRPSCPPRLAARLQPPPGSGTYVRCGGDDHHLLMIVKSAHVYDTERGYLRRVLAEAR